MSTTAVAVIGTGSEEDAGIGHSHATAYRALEGVELVGCADAVPENAEWFGDRFDVPPSGIFTDHLELVRELDVDLVSVCTPTVTHAEIVLDLVDGGRVRGIHCEKPMASTWGDSRLMAQEAERRDVQLTFNHQLRFSDPTVRAKELLDAGEIGELRRIELSRADLFDTGIHQFDLSSFFSGDVPADWVIGQIDLGDVERRYGAIVEDQAVGLWEYGNGVFGLASTGRGADAVGTSNRLIGTDGVIVYDQGGDDPLRVRRDGTGWESIDCEYRWRRTLERALGHVVDRLDDDEAPLTSARNTLIATELAFGIYESARRRGRVDLPLTVGDNPLEGMVDSGELPNRPDSSGEPSK